MISQSERLKRGGLLLAAALLLLLGGLAPRAAQAQCLEPDPGNPECPADTAEPTVTLEPAGGSFLGAGLTVTIHWCDNYSLNASARSVTLNGQAVSTTWTTATPGEDCAFAYRSTATLTLSPGENVLLARITDGAGLEGSATAFYVFGTAGPAVAVLPDGKTVVRGAGERATETFTVRNAGNVPAAFTLQAVCGGPLTGCTASRTALSLAPGEVAAVGVGYTVVAPAGLAAAPAVSLRAWRSDDDARRDSGTVLVDVRTPAEPGIVNQGGEGTRLDRAGFVVARAGPGAAFEGGDLRLAHALPTTRVLGTARTPVLLYNSQHAQPRPAVAVSWGPPASSAPNPSPVTQVRAVLRLASGDSAVRTWTGLQIVPLPADVPPPLHRFAVVLDGRHLPTGVYPYTLALTATYANGQTTSASWPGRLVVVSRIGSPFGAGWWLAGLESLLDIGGGEKLWIGGDGSTHVYRPTGAPNTWAADAYDRPDTLRYEPGTRQYVRLLPHRVEVRYDSAGRHLRTRNRAGHWTDFEWNLATNRLTRASLPRGAVFDPGLGYAFEYDHPGGRLSRVVAPSVGGQARTVQVAMDAAGRVTRLTDPDDHDVGFGYAAGNTLPLILSRTDRRGFPTTFDFDFTGRLTDATQTLGTPSTADDVRVTFLAAETRGVLAPVALADQYTQIDGPRPHADAVDRTRLWVDRHGAPWQVRDALGNVTLVYRRDPSWPGQVTSLLHPNGWRVSATYDERGNLAATTDWSHAVDGRYATTLYEWDPYWDAPTRATLPEGEVSLTQYDAQGNVEWTQPGSDPARRVAFAYRPASDPQAPGLPASVTEPGGHTRTFQYDARGNLSAAVSPLGFPTEVLSDEIGRVIRTRTPINAQGLFQSDTTVYDVMGRPRRGESFGPPMHAGGVLIADSQRVVVETDYDEEGNVRFVSRRSVPDSAGVGTITTRWEHDGLGRVVAELAPDTTPATWADNPRDTTVYDPAGNPVWTLTRRGDTLRIRYDALDRPVVRYHSAVRYDSIWGWLPNLAGGPSCGMVTEAMYMRHVYPAYPTHPDCSYRIAADSAVFAYDAMGNLTRADNADAQVRRAYFPNGLLRVDTLRVQTLERNDWTQHLYVLEHGYDLNGRRSTLTHPSQLAPAEGVPTRYAYDPATGAPARVTDPLGNLFRYTYGARGLPDTLALPAGMRHAYAFDADGRLSLYRLRVPAVSNTLSTVTLTYDGRGKVVQSTDTGAGQQQMTAAYSGLGHLIRNHYTAQGLVGQGNTVTGTTTSQLRYDALANVIQSTGSTQTSGAGPGITRPPLGTLSTTNTTSLYEPSTGRIRETRENPRRTVYRFDRAGNLFFQSKSDPTEPSDGDAIPTFYGVDRAAYYGADGRLRAVDARSWQEIDLQHATWEEHRYDALGRRVWVRARGWCSGARHWCNFDRVRRTVWDGAQVLYEIQAADDERENDGPPAPRPSVEGFDANLLLGSVLLTHGPGIDQPLSAIRMGLGDHPAYAGADYRRWPTFAALPLWNERGQAPFLAFADGKRQICLAWPQGRCLGAAWRLAWDAYGPRPNARVVNSAGDTVWMGGVLEDQQDASGLLYRRNRYYDPATGRFTQEDPVGLAGGLNQYGYAGGDPVGSSDPFGLNAASNPCVMFPQLCLDALKRGIRNFLALSGRERADAAVGMSPLGDASDAITAVTGRNLITGERVGTGGRILAGAAALIPVVSSRTLGYIVRDLYKGAHNPRRIGSGSTADAIRNETATGQPTEGIWHLMKGQQYINALNRWLRRNPNADDPDKEVARNLLADLQQAVAEALAAGRTQ
ncbi:MAG TPA: RHS repeat-associated core domain-containing protein [Longimicrobiaceae bacterium]|nr:RHS repeat-associated core domain-containing protein [Longimicrobiaceae bacterium]